jgi:phosphoenolpyruvate carboxylase
MTIAVALAETPAPEPDPVGTVDGQQTLELHEACAALLPGYCTARSETERVSLLTRACLHPAFASEPDGAIERWIVHDVQRPSDILCALWLARYSGLFQPPRGAPARRPRAVSSVELVPQFERRAAVERVTETMGVLYSNAAYSEQLWARGRHQELVLGYVVRIDRHRCDRWSLHAAARQLERQARERRLTLTVQHREAQPRASATNAATSGDSSAARVTASSSVSGAPISGL